MRRHVVAKGLIKAVGLVLLLSGAMAAHGELVDRIVAIVNDDCITLSELNEELEPYARQIPEGAYGPEEERQILSRLKEDILNSIVDQKLSDQESERLGVSVPDSEVDLRIEHLKDTQSLTEEELRKSLAAEGYTLEGYRNRIKEQLLRLKLINVQVKSKIAVTEEEIIDYYDKHKNVYQGETEYHLAAILIKVPSLATSDEKAAARKKIETVVEKLKAGEAFDELAKLYSEDITAKDGGNLGLFPMHELSTAFQDAVRQMKEGEFSSVLETPQGFQVVMLREIKKAPAKSLEEAKVEIQEKLYNALVEKKYKDWITTLREKSYIEVMK